MFATGVSGGLELQQRNKKSVLHLHLNVYMHFHMRTEDKTNWKLLKNNSSFTDLNILSKKRLPAFSPCFSFLQVCWKRGPHTWSGWGQFGRKR